MVICRNIKQILVAVLVIVSCCAAMAQPGGGGQGRKIQNLPFADYKRIHFGFSVGMHVQDLTFTHNGYTTPDGENWYMEVPSFSPGFCVNLLADLYLCPHLNLRLSPGIYFGNKVVKFREEHSGDIISQNIKSNYIVVPLDLKFSAKRWDNIRPYISAGVMGTLDVAKQENSYLKMNPLDCYLTFAFGCDTYLPYFKFVPEIKFCIGITDALDRNRDLPDPLDIKYTNSIKKMRSSMIILTFYFE
ncbi:MAG: PorT family protein [Bacteroidaceae bacterium]|nr:PorT family protein [Bacteroidaceae bacterium]